MVQMQIQWQGEYFALQIKQNTNSNCAVSRQSTTQQSVKTGKVDAQSFKDIKQVIRDRKLKYLPEYQILQIVVIFF